MTVILIFRCFVVLLNYYVHIDQVIDVLCNSIGSVENSVELKCEWRRTL